MHKAKWINSVGESIYMLPSNMNLKIRSGTVRIYDKILVSDSGSSLGKNSKVNTFELVKGADEPKSHKAVAQPTITHGKQKPTNASVNSNWVHPPPGQPRGKFF